MLSPLLSSAAAAGSSSDGTLMLDPAIRDWVLLPIFLVMFGQGLLRQYLSVLFRDEKKASLDSIARAQLLRRAQRFRSNGCFLPQSAFRARKRWFIEQAFADAPSPTQNEGEKQPDPMQQQDPLAMVGMMKQNMLTVLPNMLMMGWVSFFFSGFVLVKLPFPLTDRFRSMLQRGILLQGLSVSYVSSLSWFFINLFGLRGVFALLLGSDNGAVDNPDALMQAQMQMGTAGMMGGPGAQPDQNKINQQERNEITITPYENSAAQAEARILNLPILA